MSKKSYEKANFATPTSDNGTKNWLDWLVMARDVLLFMILVGAAWRILPSLWSMIEASISGK